MQKTLGKQLIKLARVPVVTANTSDLITTICDMGDCQNATALIDVDYTEAISGIQFWTSSSDCATTACIASTVQQTATTHTVLVNIASDDDSLSSWNAANTAVTGLTVATNTLTGIAADQVVAIELPNIRRYLVMQYNGHGTTTTMGVTFIGRDPSGGERPWTGALTAY